MGMAREAARRSKDPRSKHGAVIADRHNVLVSTGFNGPPRRIPDSLVDWSPLPTGKYGKVIHAEDNAVRFALARVGFDGLVGAPLYVTGRPCHRCGLSVLTPGFSSVVYDQTRVPVMCDDEDWKLAIENAEMGGLLLVPAVPIE